MKPCFTGCNTKFIFEIKWAATWQNQQSDCAPSEDSDQPGHPPSLLRVFAVRLKKPWVLSYPLSAQRRLIRLGVCPSWSESSLGAQSLCWFCHVAAQIIYLFLCLCHLSRSRTTGTPVIGCMINHDVSNIIIEPWHDKTNKMALRPAKTDQPGHPPRLISLCCPHKKARVLSYPLRA